MGRIESNTEADVRMRMHMATASPFFWDRDYDSLIEECMERRHMKVSPDPVERTSPICGVFICVLGFLVFIAILVAILKG